MTAFDDAMMEDRRTTNIPLTDRYRYGEGARDRWRGRGGCGGGGELAV